MFRKLGLEGKRGLSLLQFVPDFGSIPVSQLMIGIDLEYALIRGESILPRPVLQQALPGFSRFSRQCGVASAPINLGVVNIRCGRKMNQTLKRKLMISPSFTR